MEEEEREISFEAPLACSYEVMWSEWAAEGRDRVEVQLADGRYEDCGTGIGELVKGASCLYYCHEPKATVTDAGATPAAAPTGNQAGDHSKRPVKPDVAEDVYVVLEDPEKSDDDSAAGNASKVFLG